jgi:hypothetical protein
MVNRINEFELIKKSIANRKSIILLGQKGIGKTYLLKSIELNFKACYIEHLTVKNILEKIAANLKVNSRISLRYLNIEELSELVMPILKKRNKVILLDNCESISKPVARLLEKISEYSAIIAAAERKPWSFRFREELNLIPLDRNSSKELATKLINLKDNFILDLIATKSLGNPGKICEICRDFSLAIDNYDLDLLNKNSIIKFFLGIKPTFPNRINIFPIWLLFVTGFGLLIVKYFFYSESDWNTGYMIAAMGYTSLIIYRLINDKRRR